mgnify:CR=1 FL=1
MPNGIIIIDKPADWTSMDVCAKLRGILREKKIGHAGTLDPMATGVLPVFVGRATRAVEFAEKLPPMYSAIKINGKKLCDVARRGGEVERKPRAVTIYELELLEQTGPADFTLRCVCSKGTYIRTLCHDIGQALGCGGCMSSLRRTMAAGFTLAQAVTLEEVQERGETLLLPTDRYFAAYPVYTVASPRQEERCRHGNPLTAKGLADGTYRVYGLEGEFLCLSSAAGGTLTSIKNFFGA